MTDIAVSTLLQQIENHIQANRAEQALALCTHILYYFPKHLETYSLMAQALALQGNLDDALDVYRRVLSADPENAGAYAGSAHIFDYRHNWEEAVWHMERAFELAPVQPDIRAELLRLYAEKETAPRARLKLTRGALARLYVQEGLYERAIHEFRDIGSTTLSRYDIRVALAETLWRAGQTRDAAEVAHSLLDALPYCLKANLILGTAWHESAIPESQEYLERAVALDPSNQVAIRMLGARSPLRPASVSVPEYIEGAPPPPAIQENAREPERPLLMPVEEGETLSIFDAPESPAPLPAPVVEPTQELRAEEIETPETTIAETPRDFIAPEPEVAPAAPSSSTSQDPKPSILETDLPPWLQSDSELPAESPRADSVAAQSEAGVTSANPDWLVEMRRTFSDLPEEVTGVPAELIPVPPIADKEPRAESQSPALVIAPVPEPIAEQKPAVEPMTSEPAAEAQTQTQDETVPDWLSAPAQTDEENLADEEQPAWLKESSSAAGETFQATAEPRVPKWVEVLSRREPEPESIPEEKNPARSEPAAEIAEPKIAPTRSEPAAPAPQFKPAEPPPVAEYPVPGPKIPVESPAQPTQVAEPAPPIVVETPSASRAEMPAQPQPTPQPKYYPRLAQAREYRNADRIKDSLSEYEFVINKAPNLVREVIMDLEALVATGDAPLDAHRLLGDAYTRAGRLNDALERYRYVKRAAESKS